MSQPFADLSAAQAWYRLWLTRAALPLWAGAGRDPSGGGFHEGLTLQGRAIEGPRRSRVQSRQVFVYASASRAGFEGPWLDIAADGFAEYVRRYQRADGRFALLVDAAGRVLDDTPALYEQAFSLLAMATLHQAQGGRGPLPEQAEQLREALQPMRHPAGGFREEGAHPFQSNAHMHLFEAALAWEGAGQDSWASLADEIAELALTRFIDSEAGFLREFFDARWRAADGDDGRWVEPGHQFEWAWLLERWGRLRQEPRARAAARRLYAHGREGVDPAREVAVNVLSDDLTVRDAGARLWPQTEHLKAALLFGREEDALQAARGLARYLAVPATGAWRDKMRPDGGFIDEPAPASSFYHIYQAAADLIGYGGGRV